MNDELYFDIPQKEPSMIKVVGVGGGGGNAVNHMFKLGIKDVDFVLCNTDAQAMANSPVETKIQLGESLTEGKGAGNRPEVGAQAAVESLQKIIDLLTGTKMVFITAGMGGGTGTGAAPVIAKAAKELGVLTVAIVTIPFRSEGKRRIAQAIDGIENIRKYVDSLLVVNNEKILEMYGNLYITEAFAKADDVLATAAKGIAEIITVHGYINVDFADVQTVMTQSDVSLMGAGVASGENRSLTAVKQALESPLLDNNDISGARNILLNITYGKNEITMEEVGTIIEFVQSAAGDDADLIWGNGHDESLGEDLKVTVIATGFGISSVPELYQRNHKVEKITIGEDIPKDMVPSSNPIRARRANSIKRANLTDSQKVIEFEIAPESGITPLDGDRALPKTGETPDDGIYSPDDYDNIPAFKRQKNMQFVDNSSFSKSEISRISLLETKDDIVISPDNSFLNNNVD